jgi:hypothetical protein
MRWDGPTLVRELVVAVVARTSTRGLEKKKKTTRGMWPKLDKVRVTDDTSGQSRDRRIRVLNGMPVREYETLAVKLEPPPAKILSSAFRRALRHLENSLQC